MDEKFPPTAEIEPEYQKSLIEKWTKELFRPAKYCGIGSNEAKRARILGIRAPRDLPTDVEPGCFAKVKPIRVANASGWPNFSLS